MRYTLHFSGHGMSAANYFADLPAAVWHAMRQIDDGTPGMRTYIVDQETNRRIDEHEIRKLALELPEPPMFGVGDA